MHIIVLLFTTVHFSDDLLKQLSILSCIKFQTNAFSLVFSNLQHSVLVYYAFLSLKIIFVKKVVKNPFLLSHPVNQTAFKSGKLQSKYRKILINFYKLVLHSFIFPVFL